MTGVKYITGLLAVSNSNLQCGYEMVWPVEEKAK